MGSCNQSAVTVMHGSLCESLVSLPERVYEELRGCPCPSAEECKETDLEPHAHTAAASFGSGSSTERHSNVDYADATKGCPGSPLDCDTSHVAPDNTAELSTCLKRTGSEDEHANSISLVPNIFSSDDPVALEVCSNGNLSKEDLAKFLDLEADKLQSGFRSQCECYHGNILEGCRVPSKPFIVTDSVIKSNQKTTEKDDKCLREFPVERNVEVVGKKNDSVSNIGNYHKMSPLQGGEIPLESLDTSGSPSNCGAQKEQHTESAYSPTVASVEEEKGYFDQLKVDFHTQKQSLEKDVSNPVEGLPRIEKVDSAHSSQSFTGLDIGSSIKHRKEQKFSGHEVLCSFNSNSVIDSFCQTDFEGKDNGRFDYASEAQCYEKISRRSSRRNSSSQKNQARTVVTKCKKITKNIPRQSGTGDFFAKTARRKRSCFHKPARLSSWGNISRLFEHYNSLDVNDFQSKGLQISRASDRGEKQNKNQSSGISRRPRGKICASTNRIRFKVKLGNEVFLNSREVIDPEAVDPLPALKSTGYKFRPHAKSNADSLEFFNGIEENLGKDVSGIRQLQCFAENMDEEKTHPYVSILDVHPADKDAESTLNMDNFAGNAGEICHGVSSQLDFEALGGTDNRYLDSGTSPDSEVINLPPDAQVGLKSEEDLCDPTLTSSSAVVAHGDVTCSNLYNHSAEKGNKTGNLSQKDTCRVEDKLPCPESKRKIKLSLKPRRREKDGDGFPCNESFDLSVSNNASSDKSSHKEISKEIHPLSGIEFQGCQDHTVKCLSSGADVRGGSLESQDSKMLVPSSMTKGHKSLESQDSKMLVPSSMTKVHKSLESHDSKMLVPSSMTKGHKSLESHDSKMLVPSSMTKGHKVSKSSKSSKKSKCRSYAADLSGKKNSCQQKENQKKLGKKNKLKDKDIADEVVCRVDGRSEADELGKNSTANGPASKDSSNPDLSGGLPRIAWVRCDDCHKWRCIPATLADTIEETDCKWTCKDNMDKAFAECSIPQEKSNAEINAELEIDVSGEEDAYDVPLNSKRSEKKQLTAAPQSSWTLIKSNMFLHRSRKKQTIDEIMVCHCKPPTDGHMGCGDACLNRMLNIECAKGTCPCGDLCSNQQFQKRKYAKLKSVKCGKKGYGLHLLEDIRQGQFLIEYVGEVLDLHAYEARQRDYAARGHKHFYFMTLNGSEVIDACGKGNLGRFINHSCKPNCRTEKWMVNGEVCVGLFALRNIKKGEEVTFDYNYVRVFGAAAKKCVCGSLKCRGYIGGDPLNTEVIVQVDSDDEYPEPVMVCEDEKADDSREDILLTTSSHDDAKMETADISLSHRDDDVDKLATVTQELGVNCGDNRISTIDTSDAISEESVLSNMDKTHHNEAVAGQLNVNMKHDSMDRIPSTVSRLPDEVEKLGSTVQVQPPEASLQVIGSKSKSMYAIQEEYSVEEETLKNSLETICSPIKSDTVKDDRLPSKSYAPSKSSRSSSSVKKGKSTSTVLNGYNANKPHIVAVPVKKGKSTLNGSANARAERVEDKLNELLDAEGGISRRKDSPRVYLKLLLLTAASGDRIGEGIQSTRDLSMILDALLKTKSRAVLVDVINKNGLQMLHNIMKQYRRDFNKTPVLRKLLKVLEYLAMREILTSEHINGGPPCRGMESFRESILALTEHVDKQVHQIARNFRAKWIPRNLRKIGSKDWEDGKVEHHKGSNCSRNLMSHNHQHDQAARPIEAVDCAEGSCCPPGGIKNRKRKSRWDQPAKAKHFAHGYSSQHDAYRGDDGGQSIHDDLPPGFSSTHSSIFHSSKGSFTPRDPSREVIRHSWYPFEVVIGHTLEKFNSHLPVSYGIPLFKVQQYATPPTETIDSWAISPGVPFHPFPPLPALPHPNCSRELKGESWSPAVCHSDQSTPSTSGAGPTDVDIPHANDERASKRMKGSLYEMGRKYVRQQKLKNSKSRPRPPWLSKRNGCGFIGTNSRSGFCNTAMENTSNGARSMHSSEVVSSRMENNGNSYPHQHLYHPH